MKLSMGIVALVALICGGIAVAGAYKIDFVNNGVEGYEDACGFYVMNETGRFDEMGAPIWQVQIQCWGLVADEVYTVKQQGETLGTFIPNKKGHGKIHLTVSNSDFDEPVRLKLNIWTDVRILKWGE